MPSRTSNRNGGQRQSLVRALELFDLTIADGEATLAALLRARGALVAIGPPVG